MTASSTAHRRRSVPRRTARGVGAAVVVALLCGIVGACTPEQFQQWWVARGNAPLQEPQLSAMATAATNYWAEVARKGRFRAEVSPIDGALAARMTPSTWRPGCPVALADLRYIRAGFMGFDGAEHTGEIVVHADAVHVTVALLQSMWEERFPIERMQLVDDFGGSDDASMAANNTSGFNCRAVTGGSGWSEHSYGRAIDIDPVQNPYVAGSTVAPAAGAAYLARDAVRPGMITPGDVVWRVVRFVGWGWGGDWRSPTDYQHVSATGR